VRIPLVLTLGLLFTALAVTVAVSRSPLVLLGASPVQVETGLVALHTDDTVCQAGEQVPAGTSSIRFALGTPYGPSIAVEVLSGGRVLAHGSRGSEWVGPPAISVRPVTSAVSNATVCFKVGAVTEGTALSGKEGGAGPATLNGKPLTGRTRIEYLRPGAHSWASLAPSIARRMGLGNASGGTWIVFLLIAAMASILALTAWTILGDLG
jgi:hypothetical protein